MTMIAVGVGLGLMGAPTKSAREESCTTASTAECVGSCGSGGHFTLTFNGATFLSGGQVKFSYTLRWDGMGNALSHFLIGSCSDIGTANLVPGSVTITPGGDWGCGGGGSAIGGAPGCIQSDHPTGDLYGIKFSPPVGGIQANTNYVFTFTLKPTPPTVLAIIANEQDWRVKAGSGFAAGDACGPGCGKTPPTAANGLISGRIAATDGTPVVGAAVRISGTQNRLTVTDANGNYHFDNVESTGFYTVEPTRANFTFSPSQRSFSQLGNQTDAAFNATSTDSGLNPLDATEYFVRQQYIDFLNREPDESGLNFWVNNIESCGSDANCRAAKRIDTSAAFFLSIEFQQTGYLVYRLYQAAYGDMPGAPVPLKLGEFKPDSQGISRGVVVLESGWEQALENNKQAFAGEFVQRARFTAAYPTTMTPEEFLDQLFRNAGVTPSPLDRAAAINEFGLTMNTRDVAARARVLRRVAENSTLAQQEFNQAFVLMQYFGYLLRDANAGPDTDFSGYNFWLNKLNAFGGNFQNAEMVKAFLVSGEYRERFPR